MLADKRKFTYRLRGSFFSKFYGVFRARFVPRCYALACYSGLVAQFLGDSRVTAASHADYYNHLSGPTGGGGLCLPRAQLLALRPAGRIPVLVVKASACDPRRSTRWISCRAPLRAPELRRG